MSCEQPWIMSRARNDCWKSGAASIRTRYEAEYELCTSSPARSRGTSCGVWPSQSMCCADPPLTLVILFYGLQDAELQEYGLRILRVMQQIHPGDYHLNFNLALALRIQYDYEGAIRFYTAAVSLRPNSYPSHYNLGGTLLHQKKLDGAIAEFRKAIELNPAEQGLLQSRQSPW